MKGQSGGEIISDMSASDMQSLWDGVLTDADMSGKFSALFDAFWKSTKLVSVRDNIYTIPIYGIGKFSF